MCRKCNRTVRRQAGSMPGMLVMLLVIAIVVVVMMMWLMGGFAGKVDAKPATQPARRPPADAKVVSVRSVTRPIVETAVGAIEPVQETVIAPQIMERVEQVLVRAGQSVKQHQVLVKLDDKVLAAKLGQAKAGLDAAKASAREAEITYQQLKKLYADATASEVELSRAEAQYATARANVAKAEQMIAEAEQAMSFSTIRSPIDGRVIDTYVDSGDMATPGKPLLKLFSPRAMQLVVNVRESLANRLHIGEQVPARIDALDLQCQAMINEIVPQSSAGSRSFEVKVTGPCPQGVYPGMFGRIMIPLGNRQLLVIPESAVRQVGQLKVVELVIDGRLQRRAVQLGEPMTVDGQSWVEVLSGLQSDDRVMLHR